MLDDFYEKLVEEIHVMSSGLTTGEPEVIYLRLFQEHDLRANRTRGR